MAQPVLTWPQRFVRWGFARFYQEFAWSYDAVAALVSGGHWRRWVLSVLPELRGAVLELGCGPGHLQRALLERGTSAVGVDRSAQMVRRAARRTNNPQIAQITQIDGLRGRLTQADFRALPLHTAAFDSVVATFPTEQIVAAETLSEVRRVLQPGGRFVVLLAARLDGTGAYQQLVDLAYRVTLQRPITPAARDRPGDQVRTDGTRAAVTSGRAGAIDPMTERYLERVRAAGFALSAGWRPVSGGQALVLIGTPL